MARAFRMGRAIKAGRVWTNCYHQYPAHAAFGGYKASGVGPEVTVTIDGQPNDGNDDDGQELQPSGRHRWPSVPAHR
jgi:hypothetical protein